MNGYIHHSLGANPQFQAVKIFDATVFDDIENVDSGLPPLGAILLHRERTFQAYTFTAFKQDTRTQFKELCEAINRPSDLVGGLEWLFSLLTRLGAPPLPRHEGAAWKVVA